MALSAFWGLLFGGKCLALGFTTGASVFVFHQNLTCAASIPDGVIHALLCLTFYAENYIALLIHKKSTPFPALLCAEQGVDIHFYDADSIFESSASASAF